MSLAIKWSDAKPLEIIRASRALVPEKPGIYLFSLYDSAVAINNGNLYIGKAKNLRKRVSSYLVDPDQMLLFSKKKKGKTLSNSLRHTGKNLLLMEIQQKSRNESSGIWVRWVIEAHPSKLEKQLIEVYEPKYNVALNPRLRNK